MKTLPLVDGHLDLAENVTLFGRDLTKSVAEIRAREKRVTKQATVSLGELERGGIAVVFATVTAGFLAVDVGGGEFVPRSAIYETQEEAEEQALLQVELYETWREQGRVRILKSVDDLDHHLQLWQDDRKVGLIMLMEGADPIVTISDLPRWWERGLRMIGLTFGDTQYAAGVAGGRSTLKEGGLTPKGFALIESMAELGFIWDISHLTEEGVWQGLDLRDVMRAIAERDGVIGLVLYNGFLEPRWQQDNAITVTLHEHFRQHANYVGQLCGWDHVGIGSDLDGGFGLEESPSEIDTVADLHRAGSAVPDEVRDAVLSTNWLNFLRAALPKADERR